MSPLPRSLAPWLLAPLFALACQRASHDQRTGAGQTVPPAPGAPGSGGVAAAAKAPQGRNIVVNRKCMGTLCEIKAFHHDEAFVHKVVAAGLDEMDRIEALMTSWTDTSDVAHVNQAAGLRAVKVSSDTLKVINDGLDIGDRSKGAFDITVGVFKGLWRFDEDNDGALPDPAEVRRRQKLVNYKDVIVDLDNDTVKLRRKGQRLNLEGIAKGYGVDAAVRVMRKAGLKDFIFHAGGDLYAAGSKGDKQWRVGIQDPRGPRGRVIYELPITDQAFNTSGDYERFIMKDGKRYHHILDARTGFPSTLCRAVTLLAAEASTADLLDTAVFTMGPKDGMALVEELPGVEAVIIDADNKVHISSGLQGKLIQRAEPTPGP